MKKLLFSGILTAALFAVSCSGVKNAQTAQNTRADVLKLKGDWQISSVNYDKSYKIKPFDEGADINCWVGSHWKLVPNNGKGSYELTGGNDCPNVTQSIEFDITSDNFFKFKKLAEGVKAKAVTEGYSLGFSYLSNDQFSLIQEVPADGKTLTITYNFQRINP
jgi:hypothetical protein